MTDAPRHNIVIYHAHCADGMGSAYAAWRELGDSAEYLPANYDDKPLPIEMFCLRTVYIVDFSFPADYIRLIAKVATRVVILDHHKTAKDSLVGQSFPANVHVEFDMDRSGAGITWDYFHPGKKRPRLIGYIEDRDLWRFRLTYSKEINAVIGLSSMNLIEYDGAAKLLSERFEEAIAGGQMLVKQLDKTVGKICNLAFSVALPSPKGTKTVIFINTCTLISEVGNTLLERFPYADFVAGWWDKSRETRIWSLRAKDKFDVSALAKVYGGGGHPNAAGFSTSTSFMLGELPC